MNRNASAVTEKSRFRQGIWLFAALSGIFLIACSHEPLQAPQPPAFVSAVPVNWLEAQQQKYEKKESYIQSHQAAYAWFSNFAFSEVDGIPYIILKLLPELSPELWGNRDNFLDVVGLFKDERQPTFPVARGIGFSGLSRPETQENIDYASFTCGACHIGRVRLDDGKIAYLDGGVNSQFNIVSFRVKLYQTLQNAYAGETNADKKYALLTNKILSVLERMQQQNPNYFYGNYQAGGRKFDAAYETQQIALFKKNALNDVTKFAKRAEADYEAFVALVDKNYKGL
ncbi:MAG: cytochrome C, partial [Pseudomonadota bacterium]